VHAAMLFNKMFHVEVMEFINKYSHVITWVNKVFKDLYPIMWELYSFVKLPKYMFAVWATLVLNCSFSCGLHRDTSDFHSGFYTILISSNAKGFIGGALAMPDITVCVAAIPGDIIFFQSYNLFYFVEDFIEECISWVLLTHHLFFATDEHSEEELCHIYNEYRGEFQVLTEAQTAT
jgi:hypothetical protein